MSNPSPMKKDFDDQVAVATTIMGNPKDWTPDDWKIFNDSAVTAIDPNKKPGDMLPMPDDL